MFLVPTRTHTYGSQYEMTVLPTLSSTSRVSAHPCGGAHTLQASSALGAHTDYSFSSNTFISFLLNYSTNLLKKFQQIGISLAKNTQFIYRLKLAFPSHQVLLINLPPLFELKLHPTARSCRLLRCQCLYSAH